jgi:hypothetical protein
MEINEDLLIKAVRALEEEKGTAHAESVSRHLGPIADDGRCFDAGVVADDLEELESRGNLSALLLSTGTTVGGYLERASHTQCPTSNSVRDARPLRSRMGPHVARRDAPCDEIERTAVEACSDTGSQAAATWPRWRAR